MAGAIEILRREREQAKDKIRVLNASVRDLDSAIALLESHDTSSAGRKSTTGDLTQRVDEILTEAGSKGISPQEIADILTAKGRTTSSASVSSTLSRMKPTHGLKNLHGVWFLKNSAPEALTSGAENSLEVTGDEGRKPTHHQPLSEVVKADFEVELDDEIPF